MPDLSTHVHTRQSYDDLASGEALPDRDVRFIKANSSKVDINAATYARLSQMPDIPFDI